MKRVSSFRSGGFCNFLRIRIKDEIAELFAVDLKAVPHRKHWSANTALGSGHRTPGQPVFKADTGLKSSQRNSDNGLDCGPIFGGAAIASTIAADSKAKPTLHMQKNASAPPLSMSCLRPSVPNGYAGQMGEREEIKKRLAGFRAHQERLNREREDRINKVNQTVLRMLEEMRERFPDRKR